MVFLWLAGRGAHQFFGPEQRADVWPIKKVNPQIMIHLTEKPVELGGTGMIYSSGKVKTCSIFSGAAARP